MEQTRLTTLPELLAPAGTLDAAKAALAAGADALYVGLGSFNARRNAENFTLAGLADVCRMAHLADARIYVTVNILIREEELPDALKLVHDCAEVGADAFIMQDWGLLRLVHELWPSLEIHLSTQANVHDPYGVAFARDQGCSRMTLGREMSLSEIKACSHEGVELEIFGHGALCICYSGECLLSSMQRGRSANRGLCQQPCRLPYRLVDEHGCDMAHVSGTRLLSPRDNCTIADLGELIDAGCAALKIEGRMKAPDYVATVVGAYRRALDECAQGMQPVADDAVMRALARAFNRDFTDDYLHGISDNTMMSYERGNNRGQLAGWVVQVQDKRVRIHLSEPVDVGDLLEIRDPDRFDDYVTVPAPYAAEAESNLVVRLPRAMHEGCSMRVIRSEAAMAAAREIAGRTWPRKRRVDVHVVLHKGQPLLIELTALPYDAHSAETSPLVTAGAFGPVVEPARTKVVTAEDVREHVGRFGSSPFEAASWDIELDDSVGISFSTLHAVRTEAEGALQEALLAPVQERAQGLIDAPYSIQAPHYVRDARMSTHTAKPIVCALVNNPAAAAAAQAAGASEIYVPADDLVLGPQSSGRCDPADAGSADVWPQAVIPLFGEVSRSSVIERCLSLMQADQPVAVGTVGWFCLAHEAGAAPWIWDTLPLHNHAALRVFEEAGAAGVWLSPELELLEIETLAQTTRLPLGLMVYGHQRIMTCEHCILQSMGPCPHRCATCERRALKLTLRDEFDRPSLVTSDALGRSHLWHASPLDATPQIPELISMGIDHFMVDGRMLSTDEIDRAIRRTCRAVSAAEAGYAAQPREAGATSGHLFERIG